MFFVFANCCLTNLDIDTSYTANCLHWRGNTESPSTEITQSTDENSDTILSSSENESTNPARGLRKVEQRMPGRVILVDRERVQATREWQQDRFEGTVIVFPVLKPELSQFRYVRGGSMSVL